MFGPLTPFLPKEVQDVLPQIEALLKDKDVVNDLVVVCEAFEQEMKNTAKSHCTDKRLKDAFNDAASLASVGKDFVKKGKISMMTMAGLASKQGRLRESGKTLAQAGKEKHPATLAFADAMKSHAKCNEAVKRLVVKTNGTMFCLEDGENGQGFAVELLTGKRMKVGLSKADYAELKQALGLAGNDNKPQPPKV